MRTLHRNIPALLLGMLLCMLLTLGLSSSAWADGSTPTQLQNAISTGETTFTLNGDMEIPTDMQIKGDGITIVVPSGITLTVSGDVEFYRLTLAGNVVLQSGSRFRILDSVRNSGGSIINNGTFDSYLPAPNYLKNPDILVFPNNTGACNMEFLPNSSDMASSALEAAADITGRSERLGAIIYVEGFTWEPSGQVFVPVRTGIQISGEQGSGLNIANGAELHMSQQGNLVLNQGAEALIGGVVDGRYLVIDSGATLTVADTGDVEFYRLTLGGDVALQSGSRFRILNSVLNNGGSIVNNGTFHSYLPAPSYLNNPDILVFPNNTGACNMEFLPNSSDMASSALEAAADITGRSERLSAIIYVEGFTWEPSGQVFVPVRTGIQISGEQGSGLNIANGAELHMSQQGNLVLNQGAEALIGGVVDGRYLVIDSGATLTVADTGDVEFYRLTLGGDVALQSGSRFRILNSVLNNGGSIVNNGTFHSYLPAPSYLNNPDILAFPNNTGACNMEFLPNSSDMASSALEAAADITGRSERLGAIIYVEGFTWEPSGQVNIPERTEVHVKRNSDGVGLNIGADCVVNLPERGNLVLEPGASGEIRGKVFNGGIVVRENAVLSSSGLADFSKLTLAGTVKLSGGIFRVNNKLQYNGGTAEVLGRCFNLFPAADVLPDNTGFLSYADDTLKTNLLFRANNAGQFASALGTINELSDRFIADLQINGRCDLEGENIFRRKAEIRVNAGQGGSIHLAEGALLANNGNGGNLFITNPAGTESPAASVFYGELNTNGLSLDPGCVLNVGENGWVKTHDRLNIPAGAKLSLNRGQLQLMDNSAAVVEGELENNGFINMQHSSSGARLVIDGGTYSGVGRIGVQDTEDPESYFSGLDLSPYVRITDTRGTQYILVEADLILPNDLTEIGDEAFANGSFDSVYISPHVTGIADDAFAGVDGLTIYGFPGTAAQRFAEYWGYTFVPVA